LSRKEIRKKKTDTSNLPKSKTGPTGLSYVMGPHKRVKDVPNTRKTSGGEKENLKKGDGPTRPQGTRRRAMVEKYIPGRKRCLKKGDLFEGRK